jgi:uncharacterized protein
MTDASQAPLGIDLNPDERWALDQFLASPGFDERAMDLATLEGFLTALVIGPNIVRPSQWIPWIWDRIDGQVAPPFEDLDEANVMLGLVMRLYNGLIDRFRTDPEGFRPVEEWAPGQQQADALYRHVECLPEHIEPFGDPGPERAPG